MALVTCHLNKFFAFLLFSLFYSLDLFILHYEINVCYSPKLIEIQKWIEFPFPYYQPVAGKGKAVVFNILFLMWQLLSR
jgi:hypothetical protein